MESCEAEYCCINIFGVCPCLRPTAFVKINLTLTSSLWKTLEPVGKLTRLEKIIEVQKPHCFFIMKSWLPYRNIYAYLFLVKRLLLFVILMYSTSRARYDFSMRFLNANGGLRWNKCSIELVTKEDDKKKKRTRERKKKRIRPSK